MPTVATQSALYYSLLSRYNTEPALREMSVEKRNSPQLSKTYIIRYQIAPRCLSWTKLQNRNKMQSEMYDYDFKTKIKCTTMQTDTTRQI